MQPTEELQQILDGADATLKRELTGGSGNPWLACYTTRLAAFHCLLGLLERKGHDRDEGLHARIDSLFTKRDEVRDQHGWDPPQEVKNELMRSFKNVFSDT